MVRDICCFCCSLLNPTGVDVPEELSSEVLLLSPAVAAPPTFPVHMIQLMLCISFLILLCVSVPSVCIHIGMILLPISSA